MAKTNFESIDAYLETQGSQAREALDKVRAAIRAALPNAQEVISYQIPAYRVPGGVAIFFAGWKKYYSLYPASEALVAAFGRELEPYEVSKGTIRFPLSEPVPEDLISRLAKFRADEMATKAKHKRAER